MRLVILFLLTLCLQFSPSLVLAAKETPVTALDRKTETLLAGLNEKQKTQFAAIRNSHGIIGAVEDVQASVQRGVSSCGKANPDLKDSMEEGLSTWRAGIRPIMKQAQTKLNKMILLQGFTKPSVMRSYLKTFDSAVAYRNSAIKAVPVTEHKDCESLLKSMGETKENLIKLLKESLALDDPAKTRI